MAADPPTDPIALPRGYPRTITDRFACRARGTRTDDSTFLGGARLFANGAARTAAPGSGAPDCREAGDPRSGAWRDVSRGSGGASGCSRWCARAAEGGEEFGDGGRVGEDVAALGHCRGQRRTVVLQSAVSFSLASTPFRRGLGRDADALVRSAADSLTARWSNGIRWSSGVGPAQSARCFTSPALWSASQPAVSFSGAAYCATSSTPRRTRRLPRARSPPRPPRW